MECLESWTVFFVPGNGEVRPPLQLNYEGSRFQACVFLQNRTCGSHPGETDYLVLLGSYPGFLGKSKSLSWSASSTSWFKQEPSCWEPHGVMLGCLGCPMTSDCLDPRWLACRIFCQLFALPANGPSAGRSGQFLTPADTM